MTIGTDQFGGYEELSELLGVTVPSLRVFQSRAEKNRRAGTTTPSDLPAPARVIGRTPIWDLDAVKAWDADRPRHTAAWKGRNQA
jgi:hypothetical protein